MAPERVALCSALYFDEGAAVIHDDVHIGLGLRVFGVVEIERTGACDDADRYGGHLSVQGTRGDGTPAHESLARLRQRHVGARDRRGARAAIRLQHIAIERNGSFTERLQIHNRAQRASDEALNLLSPAALLAARRLARTSRMSGARQHAVFSRYPAL